jgi:hypothetical protein
MSVRATAPAIVITAAACLLLAPAAMASSGPIQVTGKQLRSALLPASDFLPDYAASDVFDSGRTLENQTVFTVPSMTCRDFWSYIGDVAGFGETAFAGDLVTYSSGGVPEAELFSQDIYQFASAHAAASFYGKINAKYRSCRSLTEPDTSGGGTIHYSVHSQSKQRVGGHRALQLIEYTVVSSVGPTPVVTYVLWTIDGADIYRVRAIMISSGSPQPSLSSLTLKLIARVSALR